MSGKGGGPTFSLIPPLDYPILNDRIESAADSSDRIEHKLCNATSDAWRQNCFLKQLLTTDKNLLAALTV